MPKIQKDQINSKKVNAYFRLSGTNEGFWIEFFSFDSNWSKKKILSSLNLEQINTSLDFGGKDIQLAFSQSLKSAIKTNKIIYLIRKNP